MKQIADMVQRSADGALLADEQGIVVLWNKAAERLLGFRAVDVIGHPCHEVMRGQTSSGHPFCSSSCTVGKRLGCGGGVRHFDIQTRTKAGKTIWLNVSSLPVPSRKKDRFLFVHLFRDIGKQAKVRHLVQELQSVLSVSDERPVFGATFSIAPASSDTVADVPATFPLSRREHEVLQHLALGERTARIADALCISPATVRNHVQHLCDKLGAHSRLEALAIAFHRGTPSA
ncbi:MAG: PAS and helix-turn-helix domain-containing protein [Nitrospirota bacterium]